ncbi:MAG: hypothetical protein EXS27_09105 [Pedosphaera sp.]|nr:hypothetical protein [Pedosphaera sp.]
MPSLLSTFEFIRDRRRMLRIPNAKAIYHAWLQLRSYPKGYRIKSSRLSWAIPSSTRRTGSNCADLVASGKLAGIHRMAIEYLHRYGTTEVKMSRSLKIFEDARCTYLVGLSIKAERRFMRVF